MQIWPNRNELRSIFPEPKVIFLTRLSSQLMPLVAIIGIGIQFIFNNFSALPSAIITGLFALSIPLQGLWWLGRRSQTLLPVSMVKWYYELHKKIVDEGVALEPIQTQLKYLQLAKLLNRAFKHLDRHSFKRWF